MYKKPLKCPDCGEIKMMSTGQPRCPECRVIHKRRYFDEVNERRKEARREKREAVSGGRGGKIGKRKGSDFYDASDYGSFVFDFKTGGSTCNQ